MKAIHLPFIVDTFKHTAKSLLHTAWFAYCFSCVTCGKLINEGQVERFLSVSGIVHWEKTGQLMTLAGNGASVKCSWDGNMHWRS